MRQNSLGSCATFNTVVTQASPQTEAADHPATALNYFHNWKSHYQIKKKGPKRKFLIKSQKFPKQPELVQPTRQKYDLVKRVATVAKKKSLGVCWALYRRDGSPAGLNREHGVYALNVECQSVILTKKIEFSLLNSINLCYRCREKINKKIYSLFRIFHPHCSNGL